MTNRSRTLRLRGALVAPAVAILLATIGTGLLDAAPAFPSSMASTGDSITRAYNTGSAFADNPAASWSTGTTTSVNSHYLRLVARNSAISGHAFNDAKTGAVMNDLAGQMTTVAGQHVDYVTVLMGANDVCTKSVASMTSVANFTTQFTSALNIIKNQSPATLVYVASIPNIYQLWSLEHNNGSARFIWAIGGICQSMLANPTSTSSADTSRRATVLQRVVDLNTALATTCATFSNCRFDGNAVYNTAFTTSDINTRDYFHPSLAGQAKLAAVTWGAGYWGP